MKTRKWLILLVPVLSGLALAAFIPSLVKAQSKLLFESDRNVITGDVPTPLLDAPGAAIEPNAIHATNGFTVHYVAKTGNGSDPTLGWSTAYTRVQDALGAALSGDEIWVARGVYTPGETVSDSFNLVPGVSVYGGFNISDTQLSDRDLSANVTVLSGDIGGDDSTDENGVVTDTANITGTNSYHVIWADGTSGTIITGSTNLDGFTITAGKANALTNPNDSGGGFYCDGSILSNECSPSFINITFSGNFAGNGGAMFNFGNNNGISNPNLTGVTFAGNSAEYSGGAVYNDASYNGAASPQLRQVYFIGNSAGARGGALYNLGFIGTSSPTLTNVVFSGNFSDMDGGAMYNFGDNNGNSSPVLINVTLSGNWADDNGGAMYNKGDNGGTSAPQVINSVLWNNHDVVDITGIRNITATVIMTSSLAQGTGGSGNWTSDTSLINGGGNIDQDPLFVIPVSPSNAPTTTGNLRLSSGSPAVDKGLNDYPIPLPVDLDGNNRKQDGDGDTIATVDMGAYESPTAYKLIINKSGNGSGVVNSVPAWINCGGVCDVVLLESTPITLTAVADTGSVFDGWSGACTNGGDCALNMDSAKTVTASFTLTQHELSVNVTGDGSGKVTSQPAGVDCGSDCSEVYNYNQIVSLTPLADSGSIFSGWSGDCSGTGACEVTMTAAKDVYAEFIIDYSYSVYLPLEFR